MFLLALGFGLGVIALTQAAVYNTASHEAGVASALLNSAQQIGVALGLAVLAGIAATVTGTSEPGAAADAQLVAGYGSALALAAFFTSWRLGADAVDSAKYWATWYPGGPRRRR
jgi:hypothetical protein